MGRSPRNHGSAGHTPPVLLRVLAAAVAMLLVTGFAVLDDRRDADAPAGAATAAQTDAQPEALDRQPVPLPTVATDPGAASPITGALGDRLVVAGGGAAVDPDITAMLTSCDPAADVVAGADRFATAVALADRAWAGGPVLLASGRDFPDALAATPAAAAGGGAVLLTEPGSLPQATAGWLAANAVREVHLLGGPAAISDDVREAVEAIVPTVRRLAGDDRFATAAVLADELDAPSTVWLAAGRSFPDAMALGPVAAAQDAAILLVEQDRLPAATAAALTHIAPQAVAVAGGPAVIAEPVLQQVRDLLGVPVRRVAGSDRFATAAVLADEVPSSGSAVAVGAGTFADALAAGPLAARLRAPILLTGGDITPSTAQQLGSRRGWGCRAVTVTPSATEALTLGPSTLGGVELTASTGLAAGHVASVSIRTAAGATMLLEGPTTITLAYPRPAGGVPAVTWDEEVDATASAVVAEQPWRGTRTPPAQGLTAAWQYTGDSERYRREVAAAPGLNVTAPFRYFLSDEGELRGQADPAFIADMQARGVQVWPTIHTAGADAIQAALADPAQRRSYALTISRDAEASGADGVNIDIEGFRVDMRDPVTEFTQVLSEDVHRWGGVTSFDFTSMTDTWITPPAGYEHWSTAPNRHAIGEAVDYSVLMAYDQFNRFRPRGPVASDAWVDEALRYQLRFTDPERILLGLPLYARIWDGDRPRAVGQSALRGLIAGQPRAPEPLFGVDRVITTDGRITWAETADRLTTRLQMVEGYGLAGTASWRLGFDDAATWDTLGR